MRPHVAGETDVVKPDDRKRLRHGPSDPAGVVQYTDGHFVVEAENGGGRRVLGKQAGRARDADSMEKSPLTTITWRPAPFFLAHDCTPRRRSRLNGLARVR